MKSFHVVDCSDAGGTIHVVS